MAFNYINVRLKLIIFLLLSILISFLPWNIMKDEFGLVEISQIFIILNSIIIGFKQKKLICKCNRKYIFWIKQILLLILFYEEISFLTTNSFYFLNFINKQNELNFHNAKFLEYSFFEFSIFPHDSINISFGLFISIVAPLIWGFGSFIKNLNSFRYIFLERSTSLFCLIYPITVIISYLSRNIILGSPEFILNSESIELFLYFLLLIDLKEKIKFYKFKNK